MSYFEEFQSVLEQEGQAILRAKSVVSVNSVEKLIKIYEKLSSQAGELIFVGIGKSGIIANKIVATFNSIGLKSSFLHPVEALHGDLGRLSANDAVVFLSKSGTTEEIVKMIPFLPVKKDMRIGLVGNTNGILANECDIVFDCSVDKEACINNLAPTTSSTLTLAMGDAMAVVYEKFSGLSREGFASYHPAGQLGKSLLLKVEHLMVEKDECPVVEILDTLKDAVFKMTKFPTGLCAVEERGVFKGILVEGDIRRTLAMDGLGLDTLIKDIYNKKPISIEPSSLAFKAVELMENNGKPINVLPVIDNQKFVGALRFHDLLKAGLKN